MEGHFEQLCSACAERIGAGVRSDTLDVNRLIAFQGQYVAPDWYRDWVDSSPQVMLRVIESVSSERVL